MLSETLFIFIWSCAASMLLLQGTGVSAPMTPPSHRSSLDPVTVVYRSCLKQRV